IEVAARSAVSIGRLTTNSLRDLAIVLLPRDPPALPRQVPLQIRTFARPQMAVVRAVPLLFRPDVRLLRFQPHVFATGQRSRAQPLPQARLLRVLTGVDGGGGRNGRGAEDARGQHGEDEDSLCHDSSNRAPRRPYISFDRRGRRGLAPISG